MVLLLEENYAEEWDYRGEGAANVVMVYRGTSPDFVGRVLRLQKSASSIPNDCSSRKNASILSIEEQQVWSDWQEVVAANSKEILTQAYAQYAIGPLLGSKHVDPGTLVCVSKEFLEALDQNIYDQRPAWRIEATKINLQSGFALLMSDHASFSQGLDGAPPCISVEIKPKCGFLPCSRFISAENHLKTLVTRFSMHQYLKYSQQKVARTSKYCPLDLFSESRDRIHQAIEGLFETPQNNLRIFLNGSLIFGGSGGYEEECSHNGFITESVVKNLEDMLVNVMSCQKGERVACFMDLIAETLLETGMLSKLLAVQKMDLYDIEGAIHAYFNMINKPCQICTYCSNDEENINITEKNAVMADGPMEKSPEESYSYLHSLSSENESKPNDHMQNHTHEYFTYFHSLSIGDSRKIVRDFLLATTAKDCSLMLTFQPVHLDVADMDSLDGNNIRYLKATKQAFRYKAHYVDLDLKRLDKMIHYYKLDQKIVSFYTRMHEADKSLKS